MRNLFLLRVKSCLYHPVPSIATEFVRKRPMHDHNALDNGLRCIANRHRHRDPLLLP